MVIWFDGLDHDLIKEFDLEHVTQEEFGTIDNDTGISERTTSVLGTSLITGETGHGVDGIKTWENPWKGRITEFLTPDLLKRNLRGFMRLRQATKKFLDVERTAVNDKDYDETTLFDIVDNSEALDVPGYNPSPFFSNHSHLSLARHDPENRPAWKHWDIHEYRRRHRQLFKTVNTYYSLCIAQFHRVDIHQHFYGDPSIHFDREKLEELYRETDKLAQDIKEFFEDSYDTIIFLSDHGLPSVHPHNKNAFYSCNHELFPDSTPHITSFHDKILELLEEQVCQGCGELCEERLCSECRDLRKRLVETGNMRGDPS